MISNFSMIFSKFFLLIFFNFFILLSHPLLLSLILILLTLSMMVSIFNTSNSMWFSFILCLIYLGGVLILFIYISSFLPNKKFSPMSFFGIFLFWVSYYLIFNNINLVSSSLLKFNHLLKYNFVFEMNKSMFLLFSLFYLIVVLLITVYYSSFNKMPLRSFKS